MSNKNDRPQRTTRKYSAAELKELALEAMKIINDANEPDETISFISKETLKIYIALLGDGRRANPRAHASVAMQQMQQKLKAERYTHATWQRGCAKATINSALGFARRVLKGKLRHEDAVALMDGSIQNRIANREEFEASNAGHADRRRAKSELKTERPSALQGGQRSRKRMEPHKRTQRSSAPWRKAA